MMLPSRCCTLAVALDFTKPLATSAPLRGAAIGYAPKTDKDGDNRRPAIAAEGIESLTPCHLR